MPASRRRCAGTSTFCASRPADRPAYLQLFQSLESALRSEDFGHRQMADLLCQQLLLTLSRDMLRSQRETHRESYRLDPKMDEILQYIAAHLAEDLSVDGLAGRFYLLPLLPDAPLQGRDGYSLHQYITQKRLLWAGELLRQGTPVMKAAELAGFRDYSTFLRAFQSTFHVSPRSSSRGRRPPPSGTSTDRPDPERKEGPDLAVRAFFRQSLYAKRFWNSVTISSGV